MKKITLLCAILLIATMSMSMVAGTEITSSTKVSGEMTSRLTKEGYNIEKISFEKDTITSTIVSTKSDSTGPNEILALRAVTNEVRALALKNDDSLAGIKSMKQIIKNSDNEIISEDELVNFQTVCKDFEDSMQLKNGVIKHTKKETRQLIEGTFKEQDISVNIIGITESKLAGYLVVLEMVDHNNDIDMINDTLWQIDTIISKLNIDGAMIGEFILSAANANDRNEIIYLMAADLMFRDFLWWQSPELLGTGSWCH